ncbi:hypothetical protein PanWU01x14_228270 [Parasponia andersonii]|uniref:Uncharacterized protein n=1 Tax=Parasponia andersonii TaxID=3476 RepID=A0A2P5BLN9_PARAD|nr:hypothetical protein PanWU01x14_228270 [Parasponia andersonii]
MGTPSRDFVAQDNWWIYESLWVELFLGVPWPHNGAAPNSRELCMAAQASSAITPPLLFVKASSDVFNPKQRIQLSNKAKTGVLS